MRFLLFAFGALTSYVIAAPLTSNISMDLSQTEWASLWTYFFWVFGWMIWFVILTIAGILIAAAIALYEGLK